MFKIYENNIKVSETNSVLTMVKYLYNRGIKVDDGRIDLFNDVIFDDGHIKVTND